MTTITCVSLRRMQNQDGHRVCVMSLSAEYTESTRQDEAHLKSYVVGYERPGMTIKQNAIYFASAYRLVDGACAVYHDNPRNVQ